MRAEFLEAIIRIAVAKFLEKRGAAAPPPPPAAVKKGGKPMDEEALAAAAAYEDKAKELREQMAGLGDCLTLEEACRRMLDHFILPMVPPESKVGLSLHQLQNVGTGIMLWWK